MAELDPAVSRVFCCAGGFGECSDLDIWTLEGKKVLQAIPSKCHYHTASLKIKLRHWYVKCKKRRRTRTWTLKDRIAIILNRGYQVAYWNYQLA